MHGVQLWPVCSRVLEELHAEMRGVADSRRAVIERAGLRACHQRFVDLITPEDFLALGVLDFVAHRCPHVGIDSVRSADGLGRVVGINTAVAGFGLGLAVPINAATRRIVAALMTDGRFRRAYVGIAGGSRPLPPRLASRLGREEVLRLAAQTGHYLTWDEDRRGSIEVGKVADLVVLDADPLTCDLDRLRSIPVDLVLVDGRVVHERAP